MPVTRKKVGRPPRSVQPLSSPAPKAPFSPPEMPSRSSSRIGTSGGRPPRRAGAGRRRRTPAGVPPGRRPRSGKSARSARRAPSRHWRARAARQRAASGWSSRRGRRRARRRRGPSSRPAPRRHPQGQPIPQGRPGHRRGVRRPDQGQLLRDKFHRLRARMGAKKAAVAVAHKILVAAFHMLRRAVAFADLGAGSSTASTSTVPPSAWSAASTRSATTSCSDPRPQPEPRHATSAPRARPASVNFRASTSDQLEGAVRLGTIPLRIAGGHGPRTVPVRRCRRRAGAP